MADTPASVEDYLAALPDAVAGRLREVRRIVREALPGSGETISYQIPMVTLDGRGLFYYAGWKRHVSIYPVPELDESTAAEAAAYVSGASTLKFPLAQPLPIDLVRKIALLHVAQRSG